MTEYRNCLIKVTLPFKNGTLELDENACAQDVLNDIGKYFEYEDIKDFGEIVIDIELEE